MSYEVIRVANGYMVRTLTPTRFERGERIPDWEVYVFNDFAKMADKLHELLTPERNAKEAK